MHPLDCFGRLLIRTLLYICTSTLFFLVVPSALALELGDLNIFSKKGEPFRAEIRVENLNDEREINVRIGIPPREEFIAADVPYKSYLKDFLFRFRKTNADRGFIEVRNTRPIDDDDIAFLLSVSWSNGGIIREYAVVQAATFQEDAQTTNPAQSNQNTSALRMEIVAGDNLENVARAIYLAHFNNTAVTVAQVMTAIRRNNAQDFFATRGAASYRLRTNTTIIIPDQEEVVNQSARDAQREINTYYRTQQRYTQRRSTQSTSRRVDRKPSVTTPSNSSSQDVARSAQMRLLTDQTEGLEAQATLQEERLSVLFEERTNLVGQVQSLDKQIVNIDNILSVKSVELLDLQQQLAAVKGPTNWFDTATQWAEEVLNLFGSDPILWSLLAVLAVILFIILKVIIFPKSRQSMIHDMDDGSNEFQAPHGEAASTPSKLELAAAFIDMGNIRQAKIILRELLTNGSPEEQQQVRSMLSRI